MSLALWRGFRVVFANPTCSPAKWWSLWLLRSLGVLLWAASGFHFEPGPIWVHLSLEDPRTHASTSRPFAPTKCSNVLYPLVMHQITIESWVRVEYVECPDQCCHPSQKKTIPAPDHPHLHELAEWEMQLQHFGRTFTDVSVWKTFYPWHHPHERNSRKRTTRFSPLGAIIWG